MSDQVQALENLSRGGNLHKDQKRNKVMRVREWTFDQLGNLGTAKFDNDDVIFMLLQEHEELHKLKEWLKKQGIKPKI